MASEEWMGQIWRQVGQLEVERVQLKRELDRLMRYGGLTSQESEAVAERIRELGERLLRMDEEYSTLLRDADLPQA